jgi:hypothetical protein
MRLTTLFIIAFITTGCSSRLSIEEDYDRDGVANIDDAFPNDKNEYRDTDGDGIGNRADPDDDNDGLLDDVDVFPLSKFRSRVTSNQSDNHLLN